MVTKHLRAAVVAALALSACSSHTEPSSRPTAVGMPRLGDAEASATAALAPYKSTDPADNEGDVYYVGVDGQDLRVWVAFDRYPDSSARLSQIVFTQRGSTLGLGLVTSLLAQNCPATPKSYGSTGRHGD